MTAPGSKTQSNAQESYFFGKGQTELRTAIEAAWNNNMTEASGDWLKADRAWKNGAAKKFDYIRSVFLAASAASVTAFGSVLILVMATIHISVLTIIFGVVYLGYVSVLTIERLYLFLRGFFLVCPECNHKISLPTFICPKCGREHDALTPSSYGIVRHRCKCGTALPATFFNGREQLESRCPQDGAILDPVYRASTKRLIAVAGAVSAGKSALMLAAAHEIICGRSERFAVPAQPYGSRSVSVYEAYKSTVIDAGRPLAKTRDTTPQAFMLILEKRRPPELLYLYDPAGEAFRDEERLKTHKYLDSLNGIVFVLDPFSLPALSRRLHESVTRNPALQTQINPSSDAPVDVLSRVIRGFELVQGGEQGSLITTPIAVTLTKIDAQNLDADVGSGAIITAQHAGESLQEARDRVIRNKIISWNGGDVIALLESRFRRRAYFATSAMGDAVLRGHQGKFHGVLDPFEWIAGQGNK